MTEYDGGLFDDVNTVKTFDELINSWEDCTRCDIGRANGRRKVTIGGGYVRLDNGKVNPIRESNADIVIIGQWPGMEENKTGIPMTGKAGVKTLSFISQYIRLDRVYITNVLGCCPTLYNSTGYFPSSFAHVCLARVRSIVQIVKPKAILLLGTEAARYVLDLPASVGLAKLIFKQHLYDGIPTVVAPHPALLGRMKSAGATNQDIDREVERIARNIQNARSLADGGKLLYESTEG